jgi:hypothetical protein
MLRTGMALAFMVCCGAWLFAAPAVAVPHLPAAGAQAAGGPLLILKGFGKKEKGAGRKDREGKQRAGGGKCRRLALKHGLPASACGGGKGSCKRLAEAHGLPKSACR